jgi:hypothetical protein
MQLLPARYHHAYFYCLPLILRMNVLHISYAADQLSILLIDHRVIRPASSE